MVHRLQTHTWQIVFFSSCLLFTSKLSLGPHYFSLEEVKRLASQSNQLLTLIEPVSMVEEYITLQSTTKRNFERTLTQKKGS